jgi:hypothetical protein
MVSWVSLGHIMGEVPGNGSGIGSGVVLEGLGPAESAEDGEEVMPE